MTFWQSVFTLLFLFLNLIVLIKGFYETKFKRNAYGLIRPLFFIGVFVWGDAVVFCLFWILSSIITLILGSWYLFLLIFSVFWVVRSLGETIYWFNQQFSSVNRNPSKNLPLYSIFKNDSVWFVYQIIWQCVTVLSIISTIYFSDIWLRSLRI